MARIIRANPKPGIVEDAGTADILLEMLIELRRIRLAMGVVIDEDPHRFRHGDTVTKRRVRGAATGCGKPARYLANASTSTSPVSVLG